MNSDYMCRELALSRKAFCIHPRRRIKPCPKNPRPLPYTASHPKTRDWHQPYSMLSSTVSAEAKTKSVQILFDLFPEEQLTELNPSAISFPTEKLFMPTADLNSRLFITRQIPIPKSNVKRKHTKDLIWHLIHLFISRISLKGYRHLSVCSSFFLPSVPLYTQYGITAPTVR